jgi:hypothetical protein
MFDMNKRPPVKKEATKATGVTGAHMWAARKKRRPPPAVARRFHKKK